MSSVRTFNLADLFDADQEDLRSHCRQHLSGYKVPKDVVFVDAVQRSAAGKGDYRWVLQTAGQALA